jgi:hypothetical protein
MAIEVPRDPNIGNKKVTKDIENYLLSIFAEDEEIPYTTKELISMVKRKFGSKYGDDLQSHTSWALDFLHFNKIIKRVGPGLWESSDGPDEIYTERETGHAEEGEFSHRGYNVRDTSHPKNKIDFNHEMAKADLSVKMLKNMGKNKEQVESALTSAGFNPVCLKLAIKKYFESADI